MEKKNIETILKTFGRMNQSRNINFYFVLGLILIVAFSRLIPHYPNFTPLCAIALFGAKYFNNKYLAYILPLFALWLLSLIHI